MHKLKKNAFINIQFHLLKLAFSRGMKTSSRAEPLKMKNIITKTQFLSAGKQKHIYVFHLLNLVEELYKILLKNRRTNF